MDKSGGKNLPSLFLIVRLKLLTVAVVANLFLWWMNGAFSTRHKKKNFLKTYILNLDNSIKIRVASPDPSLVIKVLPP